MIIIYIYLKNQIPNGKNIYIYSEYITIFIRKCTGRWSGSRKSNVSVQQSDSVFERFKKLDTRGQSMQDDDSVDTKLSITAHSHPISCIRVYSTKNNDISMISTSALDGKVLLWNVFGNVDSNYPSCLMSISKLLNKAPKEVAE